MNKINLLLFTLLLSFSIHNYAQTVQESELIGIWNVKNIESSIEISDTEKEFIAVLKKAFMESTFEFEADHNFSLNIDLLGIEDMMLKVHWNYIKEESKIVIQEWTNKANLTSGLMEIIVEKKNEKVYFHLTESPLILEVEK